ncbi:twin-arginine translocase subunit TatC [Galactobacter caseinivorans]|uniref:Sec-independent protein translocase protein TatC n=1 Tax=Galactobacter caseinivorans TaxID=2676123 RepID=A0A496PL37_9MICC|nr:twin-arginine translocase subunit TatC [Galactobacter caseinivorans]RKW71115.1 twin-arginine translocase subunit TatC [Galactobacter caseinivorans]
MPLKAHLIEARNRLFICLGVLLLAMIGGFFLYRPVMEFLGHQLSEQGATLNYASAVSPLDLMIKVSLWIGLVISSPVILWQLWAFIVPGLHKKERRISLAFVCVAVPLFVGGVALGVYVLPHATQFFASLVPEGQSQIIEAGAYIPFVVRLTLAFGVAMLIPVLMVGLNLVGILPARTVVKHWRITVFVIALFAAVAAPGGEAMTMIILAVPLFTLFGAALGLCFVFDKRKAKRAQAQAEETAETADTAQPLEEL